MYNAPPTLAVVDSPHTASIDRRRKRRLDSRCLAICAASAPPPCKTSYCCGVIGGVSILIINPFPDKVSCKGFFSLPQQKIYLISLCHTSTEARISSLSYFGKHLDRVASGVSASIFGSESF